MKTIQAKVNTRLLSKASHLGSLFGCGYANHVYRTEHRHKRRRYLPCKSDENSRARVCTMVGELRTSLRLSPSQFIEPKYRRNLYAVGPYKIRLFFFH